MPQSYNAELSLEINYFYNSKLLKPNLLFAQMLWVEHALGDSLYGILKLKHIIDWCILRRKITDNNEFENKCKEFGFYRFLMLANNLADIVVGKLTIDKLHPNYKMYQIIL